MSAKIRLFAIRPMRICAVAVLAPFLTVGAAAGRSQAYSEEIPRQANRWSEQHSDRPGTLLRSNSGVYRFSVRAGDAWSREAADNPTERSEISDRRRWPLARDFWFSFDMTILSGLPSQAKWVVVGQLHSSPNTGDRRSSPPWAQVIYPGRRFAIEIRHSAEMPLAHNPPPVTLFSDAALQQGKQYAFVYRIRYDPTGNGALDAWRDGKHVIAYSGPLGYPAQVGPYLKFGIYRAKASGEIDATFANIRTGFSVCDVSGDLPSLSGLAKEAAICEKTERE